MPGRRRKRPTSARARRVIDHSGAFVMPGLIDIHVHLSYGDAQANEDIDIYSPPEYRALRALRAAQTVMKAGYTSIADPASTGRTTVGVRDAINAGMFDGPRITTSGRQITARQGLADWYPTWVGRARKLGRRAGAQYRRGDRGRSACRSRTGWISSRSRSTGCTARIRTAI